jgi:hypothetical protein
MIIKHFFEPNFNRLKPTTGSPRSKIRDPRWIRILNTAIREKHFVERKTRIENQTKTRECPET